ncbi:carboxypeptidase regulatory-like domain-containing protein, partial [bacterium]|nr:carboxypeptidase regulatory-like domain-containing protein [bacterium]
MKKVKIIALLFVLIAVLTSCSENPSEPEVLTGTITGRIIDRASNNHLAGSQVTTTPMTVSKVTDASGNYVIEGIDPGQYTVRAAKDGYSDNTVVVNVTANQTVTADILLTRLTPSLSVTPEYLDFGTTTTSLPLTVQNSTSVGTLTWAASVDQEWLELSISSGSITTNIQQIAARIDRTDLTPGNYYGNISFTSNEGSKDIGIVMSVVNPNAPQLTINLQHLDFDSVTSSRELMITNTGTGSLNWSSADDQNWISVYPPSGIVNSGSSSTILISVDRAGQSEGLLNGTVAINSNGGNVSVSVVMSVVAGGSLPAPSLQSPTEITNTSVSLAWTRVVSEQFGFYRVYYASQAGVTESDNLFIEIQSASSNNCIVTSLLPGTQYYFKVYVYNNQGTSTPSNEVTATTTTPLGN